MGHKPSECQCSALLVELSGQLEAGHYASLKMMVIIYI